MGKKYLLPPLSEENEIKSEDCWEKFSNPYDFLINKMKLQNEPNTSIFEGGSNAVPHVYEQMILFHDAFLDKKHSEHKRAVIEWRAILILLALQRIQNIDISFKKVEFNEKSENSFLRAATMFVPEDMPVFYQTTWDFLYIICLKGRPAALVSPITLVCPSKQFIHKISEWMDNPLIKLEKVNNEECMFLDVKNKGFVYRNISEWLKILKSELSCSRPEDSQISRRAARVKEELDKFIKECDQNIVEKLYVPFKYNIYSVMNNNIRQEYGFLNFCCDFMVRNKKLKFLVERYREDVFESNIAILVKDRMPDTMEQPENIKLLEQIFPNVLKLNGKSVLFVEKHSGEKIAACVLLPFKAQFVEELIERHIVAEEFFENFSAVYDTNNERIRISLQISEFPYAFEKVYTKEKWRYLYAEDIPPVYFWPRAQMKAPDWNVYYTYTENNKEIKVSVPMGKGSLDYRNLAKAGDKLLFQLIRTTDYVSYLQFHNAEVGGYLPVKTTYEGMDSVGKIMDVFIDIGHTTTYMNMVKRISDSEYENIPFNIPKSLKITDNGEISNVSGNFLSAEGNGRKKTGYIKNMLHSFRNYDVREDEQSDLRPFSAGQILFDAQAYCQNDNDTQISFFNFEYCNNDQAEREHIHTFIEQLLLYAAYQAKNVDCSYLKIHFLHNIQENHTHYGEIFGLWEDVLKRVKIWTGMNSTYHIDVDSMQEHKALAYSTYLNANKQKEIDGETMYVGVDIGWKKTLVSYFAGVDLSNSDSIDVNYSRIEYAGSNISLMKEDVLAVQEFFTIYSKLLSILLLGRTEYKESKEFGKVLESFEQYCKGRDTQHNEYYQGIFDLIAIMIEEEAAKTDVYNNMPEYRKFIGMLTYNLFLIFLNIGCLLGRTNKKVRKVQLYVGGNGAKFIHWISNWEKVSFINKGNCHNVFILKMKESILDIIKRGFEITGKKENLPEELCIVLCDGAKEQLVKGYMFKESYNLEERKGNKADRSIYCPEFAYEEVKNTFMNGIERNRFEDISDKMQKDIFEEEQKKETVADTTALAVVEAQNYTLSVDELITEKSKIVCRDIIKKIYKMQSKQE